MDGHNIPQKVGPMKRYAKPPKDAAASLEQRLRDAFYRELGLFELFKYGEVSSSTRARNLSAFDGGSDRWGRRYQSIWPKVAKTVRTTERLDPEGFVRAQFEGRYSRIRPNDLFGSGAVRRYTEYSKNNDEFPTAELLSDTRTFMDAASTVLCWFPDYSQRQAWEHAILDTAVHISPLFRYCVAVSEGLTAAANIFREAAISRLLQNPAYLDAWREQIPQELREVVLGRLEAQDCFIPDCLQEQ